MTPAFRWGVTASSLSAEGAAPSADWSRWEQQGRVDRSLDGNGFATNFVDDLAAFAELGLSDVRLTVEWARIEPTPGVIVRDVLDHYHAMFDAARDVGLAPWATLVHTTLPGWFHDDQRGFRDAHGVGYHWARHVDRIAEHLDGVAAGWTPIEDPVGMALRGYLTGSRPPGHHDAAETREAIEGALLATLEAARLLQSGSAPVMPVFGVPTVHRFDEAAAEEAALWDAAIFGSWTGVVSNGELVLPDRAPRRDERWVDAFDLIGLGYDHPITVAADGSFSPFPPGARTDATGFAPHPDGLRRMLHRVAESLPDHDLVLASTGVATDDDDWRHEILTATVAHIDEAVSDGIRLRGAFFETGIDGYSPGHGFDNPRGLLDRNRSPKSSGRWLFDRLA